MASMHVANTLLKEKIRALVIQDPGLPRNNPTCSFWQQPAHPTVSTIQSEILPPKTDVVVIGSGITGCSVTKSLLEDSNLGPIHVTVLEARTLASGATGRNGGHLVSAAATDFSGLVRSHGLEAAKEIARFSFGNIERVQQIVAGTDEYIQEFSEVRPVEKITTMVEKELWEQAKSSLAMLEEALPERKQHHRLVNQAELDKDWGIYGTVGGIAQKAGACWPYRLVTAFFDSLLKAYPIRLSIETNTPVLDVSEIAMANGHAYPYLVRTPRGTVKARRVVYCTNGHTGHLLPRLQGKIYPFRGHVTTQNVGPEFPNCRHNRSWSYMMKSCLNPVTEQMHWGLYYLQQNAKTRDIFVGCENQSVSDSICSDDTYVSDIALSDLPNFLPRMFTAVREGKNTEHPKLKALWSGIMGMTADGLPLVGCIPASVTGRTSCEEWIAAGFNGYGMDKCWMVGESLAAMIAGRTITTGLPEVFKITQERLDRDMDVTRVVNFYTQWAADTMDTAGLESVKSDSSVQAGESSISPQSTVYRLSKL